MVDIYSDNTISDEPCKPVSVVLLTSDNYNDDVSEYGKGMT